MTYIFKNHNSCYSSSDISYSLCYKQNKKLLCYETHFIFQITTLIPEKYYYSIKLHTEKISNSLLVIKYIGEGLGYSTFFGCEKKVTLSTLKQYSNTDIINVIL